MMNTRFSLLAPPVVEGVEGVDVPSCGEATADTGMGGTESTTCSPLTPSVAAVGVVVVAPAVASDDEEAGVLPETPDVSEFRVDARKGTEGGGFVPAAAEVMRLEGDETV